MDVERALLQIHGIVVSTQTEVRDVKEIVTGHTQVLTQHGKDIAVLRNRTRRTRTRLNGIDRRLLYGGPSLLGAIAAAIAAWLKYGGS